MNASVEAIRADLQSHLSAKELVAKPGFYFGDPVYFIYGSDGELVCTVSTDIKLVDLSEMLRVRQISFAAGIRAGKAEKMNELKAVLCIE